MARYYSSSYMLQKYGIEQAPKKGPGGRSSDGGLKVTVFGCTGFIGRYLANELGKIFSHCYMTSASSAIEIFMSRKGWESIGSAPSWQ